MTCYSVSHSTFSPICLTHNSVDLLLHPQFFLNIYHGRVAAWCQLCRRHMCKKLQAEVNCTGCDTSYNVSHSTFSPVCLKELRFPHYTLSSSSIFITVVSLPGARYVLHSGEGILRTSLFYCLWCVLQCVAFHIFANLPQGQLDFPSTAPSVLLQYL